MKIILAMILTTIALQSYAVKLPDDSVAKQIQNSLSMFQPTLHDNINTAVSYAKIIDTSKLFVNKDDYNKFGDKLSSYTIAALIRFNAVDLHQDIYKRSSVHHQARLLLDNSVRDEDPIGTYIASIAAIEVKDIKYYTYAIHKAAELGVPAAQYELARGLKKDNKYIDKAFDLYKSASENGYKKAYSQYGSMLYDKEEYTESAKWLSKAIQYESVEYGDGYKPYIGIASDTYIHSIERIIDMHLNGKGVEKNKDKAVELLDDLIKQVEGRIQITRIQTDPSIKRNLLPNRIKEQLMYYSNHLNGYINKKAELISLKERVKDDKTK